MNDPFSANASRVAMIALLSTAVTIGSAIPAAASQSPNAPMLIACPPQSVFAVAEHAIEAMLFGTPDPCGLATSAAPSKDAAITGPVHPITTILQELL